MESACRSLKSLEVDIAILQETKLAGGFHTHNKSGYAVVASDAVSINQGGVALVWREHGGYEIEEIKIVHPHVLTFQLVVRGVRPVRFYVVGCYIPPEDLTTLEHVKNALAQRPGGCKPLLVGNLNVDLECPRDERDKEVAEECSVHDFGCMSRHFRQRHVKWVASKPDYFLACKGDKECFKSVAIRQPRYHDSDHRAIIAHFRWGKRRKRKW